MTTPPPIKTSKSGPFPYVLPASVLATLVMICVFAFVFANSASQSQLTTTESTPPSDGEIDVSAEQNTASSDQEKNDEGSTIQTQTYPTSTSQTSTAATANSDKALENALGMISESQNKSQAGDYASATETAIHAWEILMQHPEDPQCSALAKQINTEIEELARQANSKYASEIRTNTKRLITE